MGEEVGELHGRGAPGHRIVERLAVGGPQQIGVEMEVDGPVGAEAGKVLQRELRHARAVERLPFEGIEVGGVIAGDVPTFRVDRMPYGGVKASGTGREGLRSAIREMCEERLLVLA